MTTSRADAVTTEPSALADAFRHNAWATTTLIAACRALSHEQLTRPAPGFGSVIDTLHHVVSGDAGYVSRLTTERPAWGTADPTEDLGELEARAADVARLWEEVLARPVDADAILLLDDGTYETHVGILIAQALHHASAHREQISAYLTSLGIEPPDLQPWAYADATGRGRWVARP